MTWTRLLIAIGLLAAVAASAQEPSGQQGTSDTAGQVNELDVRYMRVRLALSKLELDRVQQINKRIPGTFTKAAVEAIDHSVTIDEEQLKALTQKGGQRIPLYIIAAEANLSAAQQSLQRVLAINQQNPGTISPMEVERLRLTAELASVGLEKARSIKPQNESQFLQWQIDRLREDLYQLHTRLAQFSRMN
ncbi:MAG TPA: hypothetical protein VHV55_21560 [Pirellulales bacterium]|jgi:hypothetical protein|nr:hypothetical protein [Pirellulales bacterium]